MDGLWERVRGRIDDGDLGGLTDVLATATPAERAALLGPLEAYEPPVETAPAGLEELRTLLADHPQAAAWEPGSGRERWHLLQLAQVRARDVNARRRGARALAIAAGTSRAADVVRALRKPWPAESLALGEAAAVHLLRLNGSSWCATVGRGVVRVHWPIAEAMLRAAGEGLPGDPAAVAQYVAMLRDRPLADDPWFPAALPLIFDDDRVGAVLGRPGGGRAWPPALVELTASGQLPRATLIDGCLRRLATGGRPGLLAPFLRMLTELAPTPAELTGHRADLIGLLDAPGSTVAGFAHTALIALHGLRPLDDAELAEITSAMLSRPEQKLIRAHLAWLPPTDLQAHVVPQEPAPIPPLVADIAAGMPAPLDVDDLAMELRAWLHNPGEPDPVRHELILDGLTRCDRDALATLLPQWAGRWNGGRAPLAQFVAARAREVADAPPVALLAFPATTAGHVDPERVLALLTSAERDGWTPGPNDLTQALLRLPREIPSKVRSAAGRLCSPAGRTFAEQVAREPYDPAVWIEEHLACLEVYELPAEVDDRRPAAERVLHDWPDPHLALWPMVTPSHREVAAAHLTPAAAFTVDRSNFGTTALAGLSAADGPPGPAIALLLAYTLANHRADVRLAAADALLALAARPGFDFAFALIGTQIAALALSGRTVLRRVVAPMTEALRGGAHVAVAQVTAAALPPLLAGPKRPGLTDLIRLDESARR